MSSFNLYYSKIEGEHSEKEGNLNLPFHISGGLALQYLWSLKSNKIRIAILLLLSFLSGSMGFFIVERVGLYTPGIASVWQSIARLVKNSSSLNGNGNGGIDVFYQISFWVFNWVFNIVCALCVYKVVGRKFVWLSILYLTGGVITALTLFNLPTSWGLKEFYLFSNPFGGKANGTGCSSNSNGAGSNIKFLTWEHGAEGMQSRNSIVSLVVYGVVFSLLNTFINLSLYALGGCTGGVDWAIFYLYRKKSYSVSKMIFYIGLIFSFFSYTLGTYLPWAIKGCTSSCSKISNFFSPIFFTILLSIFIKKWLFSILYPQFKFVSVKVFTNKFLEIRKALMKLKFPHSFTITHSYGSYRLRVQTQLEFICLLREWYELVSTIREIDKDCFIYSLPLRTLNARIKIVKEGE